MQLIFLHGPAASGKLTIARALERRLGYPVFHNHLTVDLVTTVFTFGSAPFVRLREQIWLSVISEAARTGQSLIFTFAPETTVEIGFPDRVRAAVTDNGGRLCSVQVSVSRQAQEARIANASRAEFHKLTDVTLLREAHRNAIPVEQPDSDLIIDTDHSDPDRSAETIIAHFDLRPERPVARYPENT
ncbi:MAG: hypothetical protein J2P23_14640 [Microlunatus sp.]|nr:hypothetical protein [Microlunatus sp.]